MTKKSDQQPIIVWFRDDLRLADHPALHAAVATGAPVVCIYILDEQTKPAGSREVRPLGGASRWWLAQSLKALQADIEAKGATLVLRKGESATILTDVAKQSGASAVYFNDIAIQSYRTVAQNVVAELARNDVETIIFPGDLLIDPAKIRNKEGRGLRVFTPFWKRVLAAEPPAEPLPTPRRLNAGPSIASDPLADWRLEPTKPDWAGGLRETWTPGEDAAKARLKEFLKGGIKGYSGNRDRPDIESTSRLSPHLRFGEISPRQVWHAARFAADQHPEFARDIDKFLSELGWREFSRHLLFDHPDLAKVNLQSSFDAFKWTNDEATFKAWTKGRTGYPLVDAGMRELWHSGVVHNRVRMVVASFLIKHLLIDWRKGEQWFWDTLVDADLANNPASWQWVAGSGADAAPYFRVFNPVLQGEKFDGDGAYVKRWVPELAKLDPKYVHRPWEATPMELAEAGITLGKTYPEPIVNHPKARERALAAYAATKT